MDDSLAPRCSASSRATRSSPTAPDHASIGTVQPGETFEVESVEGFYNSFASASDFTPERYAEAEKLKWAVTGPITVAGAQAGDAVAVTIHSVEVTTPGVVVYGGYTAEEPLRVVGRRERLRRLSRRGRHAALRRAHDAADTPADRLPGRRAGRGRAARHAPGPLRRQPRLPRDPRRRDASSCRSAHDGGGLYFGDCKALMGDGEIVGPPEVGALVTASAEPRARPASMTWPRIETSRQPDDARLRQAARVERAPGLPRAARMGRRGLRDRAPAGRAAAGDGRARRHLPDQQHRLHRLLRRTARRARALPRPNGRGRARRPDHVVDDAVAHGQQAVVQVDAAAGVVRDHLQAVADARAAQPARRRPRSRAPR